MRKLHQVIQYCDFLFCGGGGVHVLILSYVDQSATEFRGKRSRESVGNNVCHPQTAISCMFYSILAMIYLFLSDVNCVSISLTFRKVKSKQGRFILLLSGGAWFFNFSLVLDFQPSLAIESPIWCFMFTSQTAHADSNKSVSLQFFG